MKIETQNALEKMKKLQALTGAYSHLMGVTHLDAATAAPKGSYRGRGLALGIMSRIIYDLVADPANVDMIAALEADKDALDAQTKRELEEAVRRMDEIRRIPADEYVEYSVLLNDAQTVWEEAKNADDFASFAPYLEKIIAFSRKFAGYYNPEMEPYDALLNKYEEGLNMKTLDAFFGEIRSTIVPLLAKIRNCPPVDDSFLHRTYPVAKQREFSDYLMQVLGMDRNYCTIAETEHPFTTNFNNQDVRITTHYYENNVASSMFSVIHEGGHGIYELGCDEKYNYTFLAGGVSMGIHESQSRFYENLIGRSQEFISYIFPKMQELFPTQLEDVTAEDFYRAVNKADPSLIRTEADELTYCLHIMVRYEIEKQLIAGTLEVKDIPAEWNRLYKEYLGVDVPNDRQGCLQDTHWAGGMVGYFPSYALGSAYGPQMLFAMEKELGDVKVDIASGDLSRIRNWLGEHIHQHACFFKPDALFEAACGKFDAKFYTQYLTKKYVQLYGL